MYVYHSKDMEQEHERRRRLDDEHAAAIERARRAEQERQYLTDAASASELETRRIYDRMREAQERDLMHIEEIWSSVPTLTIPPTPAFMKANEHMIWVQWDPIMWYRGLPVDEGEVTYILYGKGGFVPLNVGDRVLVEHIPIKKGPKKAKGEGKMKKIFAGELLKKTKDGKFDILYDDGSQDKGVPRNRIHIDPKFRPEVEVDPKITKKAIRTAMAASVYRRQWNKEKRHRYVYCLSDDCASIARILCTR